ncbi:hypothetical protein ACIP69_18255 [Streptomyces hygroscopicus]|uniref:DUF6197 family protein n=1 Tax=Streptomyces hygroscopicus TaxID=1912 RepID=UPI003817DD83
MTTICTPSTYALADILRAAHHALQCRPWTQERPTDLRGRIDGLTAIGIGVAGWWYDPRTILGPDDERRYEAAVARVCRHLGLHGAGDVEQFAAWHDDPGRSVEDVLDAFQDTARSLEGYRPDRVFTPTARDVTSVHQGVLLTCYGDDGNYMAIGHIPATLMISASSECSMHLTGEPLVGNEDTPTELEQRFQHAWTVHWRNPRGEHWWDVDHGRQTPGAVPVTILPGD